MKPLLLALFLLPSLCFATTSKEIVEQIFTKSAQPEISKDVKLQDEVNAFVDYGHMAKEVLGAEYKKRKAPELQRFEKMLKDIISLSVFPAAPDFLGKVNVTYKEVLEEGNNSKINSVVKHKGEETEVNYRLHKQGENWKVYDIALDGESWTDSIREEVQKILKKEGWAGLKKRLTKRLETLSNKNKKS